MKINKKVLLFGLPILALALVSAIAYYQIFATTIHFTQPIQVSGQLTQNIDISVGTFSTLGMPITVANNGDTEKTIVVSNDNSNSDVKVSYVGELTLAKKDLTNWVQTADTKTIEYTMVGDSFKVSGVSEGYVAVYYPNIGSYDTYTGAVVLANDVTNLPESTDLNGNSLTSDYLTNGFNPDATQAVGAKIWLVPTGAVTNNVIDWSQSSSFYFETELIQFNTEGNIVISPHSSITFTPQFDVDSHASTFDETITTTVA